MMNMSCCKNMEKMEMLLDDELPADEKKQLMNHLSECTECSRQYTMENILKQTLRERLPRKLASQTIVEDIRSQVLKIA